MFKPKIPFNVKKTELGRKYSKECNGVQARQNSKKKFKSLSKFYSVHFYGQSKEKWYSIKNWVIYVWKIVGKLLVHKLQAFIFSRFSLFQLEFCWCVGRQIVQYNSLWLLAVTWTKNKQQLLYVISMTQWCIQCIQRDVYISFEVRYSDRFWLDSQTVTIVVYRSEKIKQKDYIFH